VRARSITRSHPWPRYHNSTVIGEVVCRPIKRNNITSGPIRNLYKYVRAFVSARRRFSLNAFRNDGINHFPPRLRRKISAERDKRTRSAKIIRNQPKIGRVRPRSVHENENNRPPVSSSERSETLRTDENPDRGIGRVPVRTKHRVLTSERENCVPLRCRPLVH